MKVWLPILGLSVLMSSAFADQAGQATVSDAWVRAMPPGAGMTAAFLTVHNTGEQQISIVGAASADAGSVELHGHVHEGGMMKMRPVAEVPVPAKGDAHFEPGGLHLMVMDLKTPLGPGRKFPLLLKFADGSELKFVAEVRAITP